MIKGEEGMVGGMKINVKKKRENEKILLNLKET